MRVFIPIDSLRLEELQPADQLVPYNPGQAIWSQLTEDDTLPFNPGAAPADRLCAHPAQPPPLR